MPFQSRRAPPPRMVKIPPWSSTALSWMLGSSFISGLRMSGLLSDLANAINQSLHFFVGSITGASGTYDSIRGLAQSLDDGRSIKVAVRDKHTDCGEFSCGFQW